MYKVFVTGGLASGKKTLCEYLASQGAVYYDCDQLAKESYNDPLILDQVVEAFGPAILNPNGLVDYARLAAAAFATPEQAARLDAIVWPYVGERLADLFLEDTCEPGTLKTQLLVVEIALLKPGDDFCNLVDEVLCVQCDPALQLQRAIDRGMSTADARARLALQPTNGERAQLASTVFDNNGPLSALYRQADNWLGHLNRERLF
jgi:dephospho-CoA kinase